MSAEQTPDKGVEAATSETLGSGEGDAVESSRAGGAAGSGEHGQVGPDNLDLILRRAADFLQKGLLPEAKAQASKAIAARPANSLAQNLMALTLFHQGRPGRALEIFESLVRRNPEVLTLRINAGLAALHQEDLPRALTQFREAVDLDSTCARAFGYLALVHLKLGELDLARAALQEAGLIEQEERFEQAADHQAAARLGWELEQELERLMCDAALLGKLPAPHEGFADVAQFSIYQPLPGSGEEAFILQMNSLAEEHAQKELKQEKPDLEELDLEELDLEELDLEERDLDERDLEELEQEKPDLEKPDLEKPVGSAEEPEPLGSADQGAQPAALPNVTGPHLPVGSPSTPVAPLVPDRAPQVEELEHAVEEAFLNEIASVTERRHTGSHQALTRETTEAHHAPLEEEIPHTSEEEFTPSPWAEYSHTEELSPETTQQLPLPSVGATPLLNDRLEQLMVAPLEAGKLMERQGPLLFLRPDEIGGGLLVRKNQVILQQGELTWSQAHRISKGVDAGPLKDHSGELMRVQGPGLVALSPGSDHQYELVQFADDALFVPQHRLASCSAQLRWENGHIPGMRGCGPEIIHLRGQGILALRCRGPLLSCTVVDTSLVRANIRWVLGWTEEVVPQLLHLDDAEQTVGFEGEGVVWLTMGETSGP